MKKIIEELNCLHLALPYNNHLCRNLNRTISKFNMFEHSSFIFRLVNFFCRRIRSNFHITCASQQKSNFQMLCLSISHPFFSHAATKRTPRTHPSHSPFLMLWLVALAITKTSAEKNTTCMSERNCLKWIQTYKAHTHTLTPTHNRIPKW